MPTRNGMDPVCQEEVPVPFPVLPSESVHVTLITPTLSDAVPRKIIEALFVETLVAEGERIVSVGATVSRGGFGVGVGNGVGGGVGVGLGVGVGVGVGVGTGVGTGVGVGIAAPRAAYSARIAAISEGVRPVITW